VFPFTTPFLYDPAVGNLVLDIQFSADGSAVTFDTVSRNSVLNKIVNTGGGQWGRIHTLDILSIDLEGARQEILGPWLGR
jgi:hypothetical protein